MSETTTQAVPVTADAGCVCCPACCNDGTCAECCASPEAGTDCC